MGSEKGNPKEILERMKLAYGVTSNTEFSNLTKIPISTISNWLARGSIPFRYIYECAQSTGKDIDWLKKGQLANASYCKAELDGFNGDTSIYNQIIENGGQAVLQRILLAYGFTMQKQLGELLGLSSGTMSTWVRRNFFPGDVVVACALDTGVSLRWLATGNGEPYEQQPEDRNSNLLMSYTLTAGKLHEAGKLHIDASLIPRETGDTVFVNNQVSSWIVDRSSKNVANGKWLLSIDGVCDVYDVTRMPANKVQLKFKNDEAGFICNIDDIECIGQVIFTLEKNN
ncbi:helix-turn-helix domain-containing protein [Cronobacter turicensis]|nr:helix-turn-helix domain-containing protein [Cronobacter turicensis]ELY4112499.1 helix-turn-helix domain-containing protein [Cronobacter turicensis]